MKKYSFILLFSLFIFIPSVHAEYYLFPNSFSLNKEASQLNPDFDFYGVNNGVMTSIKTLNGNSNTWYRFEFDLDGSNCSTNINSSACVDTINSIENGGLSSTIYGSFQMCVSKPQFHWVVDWTSCNSNCLQKSQDLIIINNSYRNCTLGLYNTETGGNLENDGYLVDVYFNIAKWQYVEGAYSGLVNGRIYLYNDSDSILYYKFVNNVYLSDINMASMNSGFGVFNHDYTNPDVGGETFLNNGTCVKSYNELNLFKYGNNWNRESETFTFDNNLPYEKFETGKNLFDKYGVQHLNGNASLSILDTGIRSTTLISGIYKAGYVKLGGSELLGKTLTLSANINSSGNNHGRLVVRYGNSTTPLDTISGTNLDSSGKVTFTLPSQFPNNYNTLWLGFYSNTDGNGSVDLYVDYTNVQVEVGNYVTKYQPYGGYYIEYDNLNMDFGVFHYYGTNLTSPNNIYVYLEDYEGDTQLFDMVNCRNNYVCKYENLFSFTHELINIFSQEDDKIKKMKIYNVGSSNIYFERPYFYDLYQVPGRSTWNDYYQPYGEYICADNDNGTYYNAQTKKVYYNPDNPPQIVSSNPNGQSQNIFGIEVDFYGLSSLFSIPIDIYNDIRNGRYNTCVPLHIPFPGFPNKYIDLPCMTSYVYENYPSLLSIYRIIIYGFISMKIAKGTIVYIKKWYDGTIEGGE